MHDVPVLERQGGRICLSDEDRAYIQSFAKDGEIPLKAYIKACTDVLNKKIDARKKKEVTA